MELILTLSEMELRRLIDFLEWYQDTKDWGKETNEAKTKLLTQLTAHGKRG